MSIDSFQTTRIGAVNFPKLREYRVGRLRQAMKSNNIDALLVHTRPNIRYMSDLRYCAEIGTDMRQASILFAKGGEPTLYVIPGDYHWVKQRIDWVEEIINNTSFQKADPFPIFCDEMLMPVLKKHGLTSGRIAVDELQPIYADLLKKRLPSLEVVNGKQVLDEAKIIKSEEEIKLFKIACSILDGGMNLVLNMLKPGYSENEIAGELVRYLYRRNMDYLEWNPQIQTGENNVPYLRYSTDRIIQPNDTFYADFGFAYSGYCPGIARFGFIGKPTSAQKKLYKAVFDCVQTAVKMTKPGATDYEIYEAGEKVLEEAGYKKYFTDIVPKPWWQGMQGNGVGTSHAGEPPYYRPESKENPIKLQKNMVIRYLPGIMIPGVGGGRLKGIIVVRDYGAEVLTKTPPYDGTNSYE